MTNSCFERACCSGNCCAQVRCTVLLVSDDQIDDKSVTESLDDRRSLMTSRTPQLMVNFFFCLNFCSMTEFFCVVTQFVFIFFSIHAILSITPPPKLDLLRFSPPAHHNKRDRHASHPPVHVLHTIGCTAEGVPHPKVNLQLLPKPKHPNFLWKPLYPVVAPSQL